MSFETYREEQLRRLRDDIKNQERNVYRAQTILDKLRLEEKLLELVIEEEDAA